MLRKLGVLTIATLFVFSQASHASFLRSCLGLFLPKSAALSTLPELHVLMPEKRFESLAKMDKQLAMGWNMQLRFPREWIGQDFDYQRLIPEISKSLYERFGASPADIEQVFQKNLEESKRGFLKDLFSFALNRELKFGEPMTDDPLERLRSLASKERARWEIAVSEVRHKTFERMGKKKNLNFEEWRQTLLKYAAKKLRKQDVERLKVVLKPDVLQALGLPKETANRRVGLTFHVVTPSRKKVLFSVYLPMHFFIAKSGVVEGQPPSLLHNWSSEGIVAQVTADMNGPGYTPIIDFDEKYAAAATAVKTLCYEALREALDASIENKVLN